MTKQVAFIVAGLLVLTGCSQQSSDAGSPQNADSTDADAVSSSAAGTSSTGVPACDDYIAKVKACIENKVPAGQRAQFERALAQSKASWAAVGDKAHLAQACTAATQQAKATYSAMGCDI